MLCQLAFCMHKNNSIAFNNISFALFLSSILSDRGKFALRTSMGKGEITLYPYLLKKLHGSISRKVERDGLP